MKKSFWFLSLLLLLIPAPVGVQANFVSAFIPGESGLYLGPHLEFLEDPDRNFSISQVSSRPLADRFAPVSKKIPNLGLTRSAFWFRFSLDPLSPDSEPDGQRLLLDLDRPPLIFAKLFIPISGASPDQKEYTILEAPDRTGTANKKGTLKHLVFPISTEDRNRVIYLRVESDYTALFFPLALYTPKAYLEKAESRMYWVGVYIGICIAIALLNILTFVFVRDKISIIYGLNVVCWALFFLEAHGIIAGFLSRYLYDQDLTAALSHRFSIGVLGFGIGLSCEFSRRFLFIKKNIPRADRILQVLVGASFFLSIMAGFAEHLVLNQVASILGMVVPIFLLSFASVCWWHGFKPARVFMLAWTMFTLGGMIYAMMFNGIIPFSTFSYNGFQIGSALNMLFLCIAMADRFRIIAHERRKLRIRQRYLKELSITDKLTGLYNRRYMDEAVSEEMKKANAYKNPLSLIIIDVDNFKGYNDTYGHSEGDKVLTVTGAVIRGSVRESDIPCRYGGEEFAVILPETGLADARNVAERIRAKLSKYIFTPRHEVKQQVTVSIGVSSSEASDNPETLFLRADQALYHAKSLGKNRVETY